MLNLVSTGLGQGLFKLLFFLGGGGGGWRRGEGWNILNYFLLQYPKVRKNIML